MDNRSISIEEHIEAQSHRNVTYTTKEIPVRQSEPNVRVSFERQIWFNLCRPFVIPLLLLPSQSSLTTGPIDVRPRGLVIHPDLIMGQVKWIYWNWIISIHSDRFPKMEIENDGHQIVLRSWYERAYIPRSIIVLLLTSRRDVSLSHRIWVDRSRALHSMGLTLLVLTLPYTCSPVRFVWIGSLLPGDDFIDAIYWCHTTRAGSFVDDPFTSTWMASMHVEWDRWCWRRRASA